MKNVLFILGALFILSCEKEINFTIENTEPVIVVNSILEANGQFIAYISKSNSVLDANGHTVNEIETANVMVYDDNNNAFQLTHTKYGIYTCSSHVMPGTNYRIEVTNAGYEKALASQKIPEIVEIKSVTNYISDSFPQKGFNVRRIDVEFDDPAEKDNFYGLSILNKKLVLSFDYTHNALVEMTYRPGVYQVSPNSETYYDIYNDATEIFFSDVLINGKKTILTLFLNDSYLNPLSEQDTFNIQLFSLSRDYYYYIKSYAIYSYSSQIFSERVQVYNNIRNGLGIFAGFSSDSKPLLFKNKK